MVADNKLGWLAVIVKGYLALIEIVDNRQMVINLCFSQKYASWSHFLAYTCNQKTRFGTSPIKNLMDSGDCKMHYPYFMILS